MTALPARTPRDELIESTPHGEVYLRRLRRAQLQLSLLAILTFGGIVGALPAALAVFPDLQDVALLGVPVPVLMLAVPPFPVFLALGWLYRRRADALDQAFRDLVRDG